MFQILKNFNIFEQNTNISINNNSLISNDYTNKNLKRDSENDDFIEIMEESNDEYSQNNFNDYNKKDFITKFNKEILCIILDSRKYKNFNNFINISIHSNNILEFKNETFSFDIDELFLYDDFCSEKKDIQKFTIEFYLIRNKNNNKINLLVEKWKFSYKINDDKNNYDKNYLKNKISILKRNIISYSRLLPLYQYMLKNNKDYYIDFKFYNNNKNKNKGKFVNDSPRKISLKNNNLLSFKMNIKYISQKEINNFFNEIKHNNILEKYINNPKSTSNEYEIINIKKNDNLINNNKNKLVVSPIEINSNFFDLDSSGLSSLNIYYNKNKENKNISSEFDNLLQNERIERIINLENGSKRKYSMLSNSFDTTEEYTPRNNNESKMNEKKEINRLHINKDIILNKKENKIINNIIKEYSLLRGMMEKNPSFDNVKANQIRYTQVFE